MDSDNLVELTLEELCDLREFYKDKVSYVFTFIDVAINWKKLGHSKDLYITSPNGIWRKDGSVVGIFKVGYYTGLFIYSMDKNLTEIQNSLLKNMDRFESSKLIIFYNVIESHLTAVLKIMKNMKNFWKLSEECENFFFRLTKEDASAFDVNLTTDDDVYLLKLNEIHASQVNEVWPHKFPKSEDFIASLIKLNGGYGLFLKKNDELVSWAIQGILGHLNMLQTEEKHKGKGYGKIVLKAMSKFIAEKGQEPVATVLINNTISINLFESLGFQSTEKSFLLEMEPRIAE